MKNVSRFIISLILAIFSLSVLVHADVALKLDGNPIPFEQPPVIVEGRTLVPFRAIFEALGAEVEWDDSTKTATAVKEDLTVKITIGENVLYKNGEKVELDVPAMIVGEGYTMVPARAIAEAFGVVVEWEDTAQYVILITPEIKDEVPVITMYSADGRTITVAKSAVEEYKKVGWYVEPVVQMWKPDGTSKYVFKSLVEEYILLGWYTEPVVLMWAYDGRSMYVLESQVEANKAVGWYENKADVMETVYAPDGRTQEVFKAFVDREKSVGWMDRDEFEEYLQPWVEAYGECLKGTYGSEPEGNFCLVYDNYSQAYTYVEAIGGNYGKLSQIYDKYPHPRYSVKASVMGGGIGKTNYANISQVYEFLGKYFSENVYPHQGNYEFLTYDKNLYVSSLGNIVRDSIYLGCKDGCHYVAVIVEDRNLSESSHEVLEISKENDNLIISSIKTGNDAIRVFDWYYSFYKIEYLALSQTELDVLAKYLYQSKYGVQDYDDTCDYMRVKNVTYADGQYALKVHNFRYDENYIINFSIINGIPVLTSFVECNE